MRKNLMRLTAASLIAALYVVLTFLCAALGIANGAIQIRLSEALNALCLFTPAAIPGLFVGCILSNLLTGCAIWDVIFGSLATLLGALGAYLLRKHPIPALLMPVITNALILPPLFVWVYHYEGTLWFFVLTIAVGQLISCTVAGMALKKSISKGFAPGPQQGA